MKACSNLEDASTTPVTTYELPSCGKSTPTVERWEDAGKGGCPDGLGDYWINIGTANSLREAKDLMLAHELCSQVHSMLFYSSYSKNPSWGVRCAVAESHGSCRTDYNRNWQRYILHSKNLGGADVEEALAEQNERLKLANKKLRQTLQSLENLSSP